MSAWASPGGESLFDQIAAHDPLLAVKMRSRLEALSSRIEDLEPCPRCARRGLLVEHLTKQLAEARRPKP